MYIYISIIYIYIFIIYMHIYIILSSPHMKMGGGFIFQSQWGGGLLFHMDNGGISLYGGVTMRDFRGGLHYQFLAELANAGPKSVKVNLTNCRKEVC